MPQRGDSSATFTIRPEQTKDIERVRQINEQTFEPAAEARLVDLLRDRGKLIVSLVAEAGDDLLGHIAFSRVSMASCPERRGVGLGPMAVLPAMQRRGIGSALLRGILEWCRDIGYEYAGRRVLLVISFSLFNPFTPHLNS